MKEIHLPPILFLIQWTYNIIRWLLGFYTCADCGEIKNVFKSTKHNVHSYDMFRGDYNYRIICNECLKK